MYKRTSRVREFIPHFGLIPKIISFFICGIQYSDVTTRVAWTSSWRMKMRVKPHGLSTCVKFTSQDWLFLDPAELSEIGSDLKII